ncbi:MAG: hypothetical protein AAGB24_06700 [Bacteroidota bacterium]
MKTYLTKNVRRLKTIKIVLAVLLGVMIVIDIVLVALGPKGWPTFSKVVFDTQGQLVWLSFLFGGLVAKIFYNRKVPTFGQELLGFTSFSIVVFLLFLLGYFGLFPEDVSNEIQLAVLLFGGFFAYGVWPQYLNHAQSN